jgi:hypothetical protein
MKQRTVHTGRGSVPAPDQNGPSLQELVKIDRAAAEQAALKAVPGTVLETELKEADGPGDTKTLMGQARLKTLIEECPRACGESRDG